MKRRLPPLTPGAAMRWDMVRRLLPNDPGDLLEIGCGQGRFSVRLAERSRSFLGLEPDRQSFTAASQLLPDSTLNIAFEGLPTDRTFNTVCAFEVIEHLADDGAALAAWIDRVRPGGTMLISAPAFASRLGSGDRMVGHYRRYDPGDMARMLSEAGLIDVKVRVYGGPLGWLLEEARNLLANRKLAKADVPADLSERTAGSGRFMQPGFGTGSRVMQAVMRPFLLVQHAFPNKGVALVASGRRPEMPE